MVLMFKGKKTFDLQRQTELIPEAETLSSFPAHSSHPERIFPAAVGPEISSWFQLAAADSMSDGGREARSCSPEL